MKNILYTFRRIFWRPKNYFCCTSKIPHFLVEKILEEKRVHDGIRLVLFQSQDLTDFEIEEISKLVLMYGTAFEIYYMLQVFPILGFNYEVAFTQLADKDSERFYTSQIIKDLENYRDRHPDAYRSACKIMGVKKATIIQIDSINKKKGA